METHETLQFYRKRQGLSQIELAEALDVSRQTVSKWETGAALPSAENLLALSKLYGVTVDALLNGGEAEAAPVPAEPPVLLSEPETAVPLRPRWPQMLAAVLLFDLVMFLLDFYLNILTGGYSLLYDLLRLIGCLLIGLAFARWDRDRPIDRKRARCVGLAALALGVYVFLMPVPLLWRLYDRVAWIGTSSGDAILPTNPFFFFLGFTLADEYTFASHMFLIAAFLLARLRFSRKAAAVPQSQHA